MAKVRIFLEEDETLFEAEQALVKAFSSQNNGEAHRESFEDPAMEDLENRMENIHSKIYQEMIQDIFLLLEEDYRK